MERLKRLARPADFARVRRQGASAAGKWAVLLTLANGLDYSRFGFAAGKAVGGAVQRNRAKRLLREAVRAQAGRIQSGWDVVCIARAAMARARLAEVSAEIAGLLRRARLLQPD